MENNKEVMGAPLGYQLNNCKEMEVEYEIMSKGESLPRESIPDLPKSHCLQKKLFTLEMGFLVSLPLDYACAVDWTEKLERSTSSTSVATYGAEEGNLKGQGFSWGSSLSSTRMTTFQRHSKTSNGTMCPFPSSTDTTSMNL
jgi:hypothetical protein